MKEGAKKSTTVRRNTIRGRIVRRELAAQRAIDAVGPISRGCEIFGLTMGEFSLVDLIEHCLAATGPADVDLQTWTAGGADISFARRLLINGLIRKLRFVTDFSFPSREPAYCAALREAFGDDAIRITKTHAKFVVIRNAEWNLAIRTSMNLNENRRIEQFEVSDDPAIAGWLARVVDELFAKQLPAETFARRPYDHVKAFDHEFAGLHEARQQSAEVAATYFGDGDFDVDLRRVGISYT